MSAAALWKEYDNNALAAEKKYRGKQVTIDGRISAIKSSPLGYPEVHFGVGTGMRQMRCLFPKNFSDRILELSKGQWITVTCTVQVFVLGSVLGLDDCELCGTAQ